MISQGLKEVVHTSEAMAAAASRMQEATVSQGTRSHTLFGS